jgi:hypothetical protein
MYFKKQLQFAAFIAIALAAVIYQMETNHDNFADQPTVATVVESKDCRRLTRRKDYSNISVRYKDKSYVLNLSYDRCGELAVGDTISVRYNNAEDSLLWPELSNKKTYRPFVIFLGAILFISLIPYKRFIS